MIVTCAQFTICLEKEGFRAKNLAAFLLLVAFMLVFLVLSCVEPLTQRYSAFVGNVDDLID